jgi:hypothetical protein
MNETENRIWPIPHLSEQVRRETKNAQSPNVAGKFDPSLSLAK